MKTSTKLISLLTALVLFSACSKEARFYPEDESVKVTNSIATLESGGATFSVQAKLDKKNFEYITEWGFVYSTNPIEVNKDTITNSSNISRIVMRKGSSNYLNDTLTQDNNRVLLFNATIKGLTANRTYYIKAYTRVGNNRRCGYSDEIEIQTPGLPDEVSIAGKIFKINNYNGDEITDSKGIKRKVFFVKTKQEWDSLCNSGKPAYCYENWSTSSKYGKLYNYWAMKGDTLSANGAEDIGNLAPSGWHVANSNEFKLIQDISDKWSLFNIGEWDANEANNRSYFGAMPGGYYSKLSLNNDNYGVTTDWQGGRNSREYSTVFWSDYTWNYQYEIFALGYLKSNSNVPIAENYYMLGKAYLNNETSLYRDVKNHAYYIRIVKN